jgi:hypothetical protein
MTERDTAPVGYRGPLTRALGSALAAAAPVPEDAAAVALARRYATLIDDAAVAAKYRRPLATLRRAVAHYDREIGDDGAAEALGKVTEALAAHSVASDLGPKLLAALAALGMTTAGRGAKGGESGGIAARLDEFTAARARKHPA